MLNLLQVWPNIMDLLGKNKKIILVGTKVDLLPQDSKNYLRRIEESMQKNFIKKCSQSGNYFFLLSVIGHVR